VRLRRRDLSSHILVRSYVTNAYIHLRGFFWYPQRRRANSFEHLSASERPTCIARYKHRAPSSTDAEKPYRTQNRVSLISSTSKVLGLKNRTTSSTGHSYSAITIYAVRYLTQPSLVCANSFSYFLPGNSRFQSCFQVFIPSLPPQAAITIRAHFYLICGPSQGLYTDKAILHTHIHLHYKCSAGVGWVLRA